METKRQIRQEILSRRDAVSESERARMSEAIFRGILELPEFRAAEQVLMFAGYGSEPDTLPWIQECIHMGKRVFCPRVIGEVMEFYEIKALTELVSGYKGIQEPLPDEQKKYSPMPQDFMLVPGTVFDREGNRIGYGKGFYDRYLSDVFCRETAAVAFSLQLVEKGRIPVEATDRKMKCIVTELETIRI